MTRRERKSLSQIGILPTPTGAPYKLEFVSIVRSGGLISGDFFDLCCHNGEETWMFLGDVTGQGPRAGLVKLIAQTILTSLVKARPGISPRELNFLANRSLCSHLDRFGEQRYLSIVSIVQRADRFVVSGSHDSMFLVRAATGTVEEVELTHFPFGLGLIGYLEAKDFAECEVALSQRDILYAGTDGVTEAARDCDHVKGIFGEERLKRFLLSVGQAPLEEARDELLETLDAFTGGRCCDDMAFLMIRPLVA